MIQENCRESPLTGAFLAPGERAPVRGTSMTCSCMVGISPSLAQHHRRHGVRARTEIWTNPASMRQQRSRRIGIAGAVESGDKIPMRQETPIGFPIAAADSLPRYGNTTGGRFILTAPVDTLRCAVTSGTPRQPKPAGSAVGIPLRAFAASHEMVAEPKPGDELTVAVATKLRREERRFNRGGQPPGATQLRRGGWGLTRRSSPAGRSGRS